MDEKRNQVISGENIKVVVNGRAIPIKAVPTTKNSMPPKNASINVGIALLRGYFSRLHRICHYNFYLCVSAGLEDISKALERHGHASWEEDMLSVQRKLLEFGNTLVKDDENMITESLKEELIEELLDLPPLDHFYFLETAPAIETDETVQKLIDAVKEDVKKGNRATFKLMQELEMKLEEFATHAKQDQNELVHASVKEIKKQNGELLELGMELLDQMDMICNAVQQLGNEELEKEVRKVVEDAVLKFERYGLEELQVRGTLIDGKTMISLGNVPRQQYAPDLAQYHVYSVHKRGFRNKETKEIIRKATVITVD